MQVGWLESELHDFDSIIDFVQKKEVVEFYALWLVLQPKQFKLSVRKWTLRPLSCDETRQLVPLDGAASYATCVVCANLPRTYVCMEQLHSFFEDSIGSHGYLPDHIHHGVQRSIDRHIRLIERAMDEAGNSFASWTTAGRARARPGVGSLDSCDRCGRDFLDEWQSVHLILSGPGSGGGLPVGDAYPIRWLFEMAAVDAHEFSNECSLFCSDKCRRARMKEDDASFGKTRDCGDEYWETGVEFMDVELDILCGWNMDIARGMLDVPELGEFELLNDAARKRIKQISKTVMGDYGTWGIPNG